MSSETGRREDGAVALPVLADSEKPRRKRNYAKWRTISLSLVYVVFALHIAHWKITGKTLAPLELNEVMYTLELGIITAGFLFMCFLVVGTLIFGRFFCSWACHIIVLQDFCSWILRKLRIKPKPIRSRLLLMVPPLTAFYMFIWPQIVRTWQTRSMPTFYFATDRDGWASFVTNNFWRNLPDASVIILTFVICGFVIVYVLGSRTFCNYVCPYGAIFALADRFSPGRIVVNDNCKHCGKCTAVCPSDIRVHEEVSQHGLIVNPACLKDLDCISACPEDALRYTIAKPALFRSVKSGGRFGGLPYDFSLVEELIAALVFVVVLFSFRGLYSRVPFLLALAMGGIIGYFTVSTLRLIRLPNVRVSSLRLKALGRLTPSGWGYVGFFALLTALVAHSGFVRYHEYSGLTQTAAVQQDSQSGGDETLAAGAFAHLTTADRWGLFRNERVERSLVSLSSRLERFDALDIYAGRFLERHPDDSTVRVRLGYSYAKRGRPADARRAFLEVVNSWSGDRDNVPPGLASAHRALGALYAEQGEYAAARAHLTAVVALDPGRPQVHADLGGVCAELGRFDEAVVSLTEAVRLDPELPGVQYNLGTILGMLGRFDEAIPCYERALSSSPDDPELHNNLGLALMRTGNLDLSSEHLERALSIAPQHADAHFNLASLLIELQAPEQAAGHLRTAARLDPRYARILGQTASP